VRNWSETRESHWCQRTKLAVEGRPVFIIADHYGMAAQLSFYIPECKAAVQRERRLFTPKRKRSRAASFIFGLVTRGARRGQNAIFVDELPAPKLVAGMVEELAARQGPFYSDAATSETGDSCSGAKGV
jgi:hypothetical protein